jgi:hypothetical protein
MGAVIPPAPIIPFIQLLIIVALTFIPIYWIYVVLISIKRCIYTPRSMHSEIRKAAFNICTSIVAPVIASIILWILFFAQIAVLFAIIIYYIVVKPIRNFHVDKWLSTWTVLRSETKIRQAPALAQTILPLAWFPYQYSPSLVTGNEIRLLALYPGSPDDTLTGDIIRVDLRWRTAYDALSYTWADESGDNERSQTLQIVEQLHSRILVTKNCDAALRRFRHPKKRRLLWVDAICIDQSHDTERSHQVSLMSKIYVNARYVFAYTGNGTPRTDLLYDWLNSVDVADLRVPSTGVFKEVEAKNIILRQPAHIWNAPGGGKDLVNGIAIAFERYWRIGAHRFSRLSATFPLEAGPSVKINIPKTELDELVIEYFSRRWFKRVWVLQEVSLPPLNKTRIMCGSRTTTAKRALHLASLLKSQESGSLLRIFVLVRERITAPKASHLLDILIETRHRECSDPRDKIFGVLNIARWMDGGKFQQVGANYEN